MRCSAPKAWVLKQVHLKRDVFLSGFSYPNIRKANKSDKVNSEKSTQGLFFFKLAMTEFMWEGLCLQMTSRKHGQEYWHCCHMIYKTVILKEY